MRFVIILLTSFVALSKTQQTQTIIGEFFGFSFVVNNASVFDENLPLIIEATNAGNEAGVSDFFANVQNVQISMFNVFHPTIIERFPNLETIYVNTRMQRIAFNSFENCARLWRITFEWNSIREIPARVFRNCSTVTKIQLNNNWIPHLDAEAFVGLTSLTELNLNNNHFTTISPGTFINLPVINSINLQYSRIERIDPGTFSIAIRNLNFNNASIAEIHPDAFQNLRQLTTLSLNANPLIELPQGVFRDLQSLVTLRLSDTNIRRLNSNSFGQHPLLSSFLIQSTRLDEIERNFFNAFVSLLQFDARTNICVNETLNDVHLIDFNTNPVLNECFENWLLPRENRTTTTTTTTTTPSPQADSGKMITGSLTMLLSVALMKFIFN